MDIDSIGIVERLRELAQSEFEIIEDVTSYHALYLRLKHFLKKPAHFIKGWQDSHFKQKEISKLKGINRWWFQVNTSLFLVWFW
jgi:hypothetical protein